ncbi:sensor histidine kinase [Tenacibaculum sp. nBUS_03]|uniref:sensor histidine kinase n=1 Tax=Tenacibaculum sp. nBUS_03 TaxID=3395320 RepID=UPI003EB9AE6D
MKYLSLNSVNSCKIIARMLDFLKKTGKLEPFEIKSSSLVLALVSPGLYIYSILISEYNLKAVEIPYMREVFVILFLIVGLLPLTKKESVVNYYGIYVFLILFVFQHYLTYTAALNNFSIDYLLGTYIVMFGAILMLNNRGLILVFSASQLLHMWYRVSLVDADIVTEGAILMSTATIFIYSFIILNGFIRYRQGLLEANQNLESKIKQRTLDLENRAKQLYERNKDLEEFAYVVSHDLKRPLRNIHALASWVVESDSSYGNKLSEVTENLVTLQEQVDQMDLLINGILNYSLQMDKEKEVKLVDVDKLVKRISMVNSTNKSVIEIKNKLPKLLFNESQLLQVFQNLIQNAIKHNDKITSEIEIDYKKVNNEHVFSVSDNGPGIEEKYHAKIFQLFQKLGIKSHIDSIGIGLALVKKIIERNGGRIWVESILGEGTTFFITIREH